MKQKQTDAILHSSVDGSHPIIRSSFVVQPWQIDNIAWRRGREEDLMNYVRAECDICGERIGKEFIAVADQAIPCGWIGSNAHHLFL